MVLTASLRSSDLAADQMTFGRHAVQVGPLVWDTDFFGARMASLVIVGDRRGTDLAAQADALAHDLRSAIREAELDGYRHLSLRVGAEDSPAIWAAERAGLRLMDVAVDLHFRFDATPLPAPGSHTVRLGEPRDIPAMREMTQHAFGLTRYALDPFFAAWQVDAFYATWATNLFSGLADAVLVAEIDGDVAGFVSCKTTGDGSGRIPLVATSSRFQRRGVARAALAAALKWFADAGCHTVFVKTQAANYPAVALYERAGFATCQSELTFTTTLNQEIPL